MVGKFLAAWVFAGIALLLTFPMVLTVNYLGDPDNGAILTGYLGSWLLVGAYLSVGSCMSALAKKPSDCLYLNCEFVLSLCGEWFLAGFRCI